MQGGVLTVIKGGTVKKRWIGPQQTGLVVGSG